MRFPNCLLFTKSTFYDYNFLCESLRGYLYASGLIPDVSRLHRFAGDLENLEFVTLNINIGYFIHRERDAGESILKFDVICRIH